MKTLADTVRDEGSVARWVVWTIVIVAALAVLFLAARRADSTMLVGRVEAITGNVATVSVAELDRTFDVESVDPGGLEVGRTVIVQVQGDEATLEATSPGTVKFIVSVKDLVP